VTATLFSVELTTRICTRTVADDGMARHSRAWHADAWDYTSCCSSESEEVVKDVPFKLVFSAMFPIGIVSALSCDRPYRNANFTPLSMQASQLVAPIGSLCVHV